MNNYLIYKHTSPSGKSYIGQTNNYDRRCSEHQTRTACRAFHSAIKLYGWDNFSHEILHENLTIEQANELEEQLIKEYNTLSPNGYNLKTGGLNSKTCQEIVNKVALANKGKTRSQETRNKMSLVKKGKTHSQETLNKMSLANKGKTHSQESRDKMSLAKKNISQETRDKLSLANKNRTQELKDKISLTRKSNTFEKLKQQYLQVTLTENNYSAKKLAKLLSSNIKTITNYLNLNPTTHKNLGHYIITTQQIHDYFNQPNPYTT